MALQRQSSTNCKKLWRGEKMKSLHPGKSILVSVENITPFGIWLFVKKREYFLDFKEYPYFKEHPLKSIQNVQLLHGVHLYWPDLDIDLEIDNLENPQKYPLKSKKIRGAASRKCAPRLRSPLIDAH
jgi:hypothetical protein